jgi:ribosomal RNA-processing protein 36
MPAGMWGLSEQKVWRSQHHRQTRAGPPHTRIYTAKTPATMPLSTKLDRKLRAAEESSDGEEYYEVTDRSSSESVLETGAGGEVISSEDEDGEDDGSEDEARVGFSTFSTLTRPTNMQKADALDDDQVQAQMSKVSFGALAKAQDALSKEQSVNRKRKRGDDKSKSQDDKLEALRERLRQIKAEKMASGAKPSKKAGSAKKSKVVREEVPRRGRVSTPQRCSPASAWYRASARWSM